ncbi:hypothetical protein SD81_011330 [Tolypothrix campylonemoides VB511288]|nr:hypothetical protein SD81_011330 [Tolypothrix campylonemoides VB511288]
MVFSSELASDSLQASQGALNSSTISNFDFGIAPDIISGINLPRQTSSIFTVNSIADVVDDNDGVTTLREAINQANAIAGTDAIVFDLSLFSSSQAITLSLGQLSITDSLSINAPVDPLTGSQLLTVSGNNASRVFEIGTEATVSLFGLLITDGSVTGDNGGGINNSGTLILANSIVRNNSVRTNSGTDSGAGIYNTGTLIVSNSTISRNSNTNMRAGGLGGGIYNSGTAIVSNSTINDNSSNRGGGIYNLGTLTVSNSTISGNSSSRGGGIDNTGLTDVRNTTISDNAVTIRGFANGGGIYNSGTLRVSNSTLSGNSVSALFSVEGGGIYNSGTATVSNSTLSGNESRGGGGGIFNSGTLSLVFSTLTLNRGGNGGGIFNNASSTVTARNTIIAGNVPFLPVDSINPDVSGNFISNGYNLIGDTTGSSGFGATGDIVGSSTNPIDPRLAALSFNGGPTETIALLEDSPAINAGDPTLLATDPTTDQRGNSRVSGGRADIGAFELT